MAGRRRGCGPSLLTAALGFVFALGVVSGASPQDLRELEPPTVPPQVAPPEGERLQPPRPAIPEGDETVRIDVLKGLIFVADPTDVERPAALPPEGVDISRVPRLQTPEVQKILDEHLNRPVSLASLNRLVAALSLYCFQQDLPIVSITLPEQDITNGVVQVLVVGDRLGELKVEGAKYFSEELYRSALRLKPGDFLRKSVMDADIAWLNQNPFRRADFFLAPGGEVGRTNLSLRTQERFPVRVYTGYRNTGSEVTGRNELFAGFNWGNAFGLGHLIDYQYTTSLDFRDMQGHGGSYAIPLPWRHYLTFSGSHSEIRPTTSDLSRGTSAQVGLRYDAELPGLGALRHSASGMFEYKTSDNNLLFDGIPVTDNLTQILQWSALYSADLPDPWGDTTLEARVTYSPGKWAPRNNTQYFDVTRSLAKASYAYTTLELDRTQPLLWDFALALSGTLQFANGNLLGSEQLELGGVNTVRGYNEGEEYGDQGYLLKVELRAPSLFLDRWFPTGGLPTPLQVFGFYDHGVVGNVHRLDGELKHTTLTGAGLGWRLNVGRFVAVDFTYGWRLVATPGVTYASRGYINVVVSY